VSSAGTTNEPVLLRHGRVELALHRLRDGDGHPLLILHGLGEASPATVPVYVGDGWSGPVWALDFTGHGRSTVPAGAGGYSAETFMSDVDAALAHLGPATVLGRGLGAYVALLISGARPNLVLGAILADGPGLLGGGSGPLGAHVVTIDRAPGEAPDPYAIVELTRDTRPPDYATSFVHLVNNGSELATPLTVAALVRPPWLEAVVREPGVQEATIAEGLALYARP
jgi:pimeloyl-ACP methyl ester carboxylesterase